MEESLRISVADHKQITGGDQENKEQKINQLKTGHKTQSQEGEGSGVHRET